MNMQDNELDNLFRSGLSQIEVEPDARVWKGVDAHINPDGKKSRLPLMRIAASIVMVLTASIWLLNQNKQPKLVKGNGNSMAGQETPATVNQTPARQTTVNAAATLGVPAAHHSDNAKSAIRMAALNHNEVQKKVTPVRQAATAPAVQGALPPQAADAAVQMAQNKSLEKPVLPDIALTATLIANDKPVLKTNVVPATLVTAHATESKTKKHGIHTLGDLINVVVAKVDKREDKLIEFTDVDDEATVTGINLGFIKIKQDK